MLFAHDFPTTSLHNQSTMLTLNSVLPASFSSLEAAFSDVKDLLKTFATDQKKQTEVVTTAFGTAIDQSSLNTLASQLSSADFT
ncbi:MAG: hypothetical protein AAFP03_09940, partial [Cyanobacteria bacterium J06598_3]